MLNLVLAKESLLPHYDYLPYLDDCAADGMHLDPHHHQGQHPHPRPHHHHEGGISVAVEGDVV